MTKSILFFIVLLTTGCSTATVSPDVLQFGKSVENIAKRDAAAASKRKLSERVAEAKRQDLAGAGAVYTSSDAEACAYVQPALQVAPPRFRDACKLVPKNERGEIVATIFDPVEVQAAANIIAPARNKAVAQEFLALEITKALQQYASGLQELSTSSLPEELGQSTSKAYSAATDLIDSVQDLAKVNGEASPKRKEIGSLLTRLTTEVAETARYRMLRRLVNFAVPFVQKAAV
ncbi:MAG: hypothetical protein AAF678_11280, partial [Pseudomonadota bacterium]